MIHGCDISKWQGQIDFDQLAAEMEFVVIRSSYGVGKTDQQFTRNRDEARRVGIHHGFYHYAYPQWKDDTGAIHYNDPEAEAAWFLEVVGKLQTGEFLALDFEESWATPVDWCLRFLTYIRDHLNGYKPLVYLNQSLINAHDWSPVVAGDFGLWVARYGANTGFVDESHAPSAGAWPFYAMWQYTSKGSVAGLSPLDLNRFYGDKDQLWLYGYQGTVPETPITITVPIEPDPTPEVEVPITHEEALPAQPLPIPNIPPMVFSTSKAGLATGALRALKVIGWHLASNIVVALGAWIAGFHVSASDEKYLIVTASIALANALLAGAGKWLKTVEPADIDED